MGHDWALSNTQERLFINWIDTCREGKVRPVTNI
jgi:hypothetical protein